MLKDGKPYRGIGINYFDCFLRTLNKADDTSYDAGFAEPPLSPGFRWGGCGRVEKGNPYQLKKEIEPPPTPGLRREGSRGVEKGNY